MEEEGSWPRLGLLLLSGVVVLVASFVLTCLSLVTWLYERGLLGGFINQPPRGTMVMLQVDGSGLSVSGDPG